MIDIYSWPTPNGHKIHIMLEETGLPYRVHGVNPTLRRAGMVDVADGGVGPMFGQANHFRAYSVEKISYAIDRYTNEANRLTGVLDKRLGEASYLAGDQYSIADMAVFPWMRNADKRGVNLSEYPHAQRWFDAINARPAVQRALQVLSDVNNTAPHDEKSRDILFGKTQFQRR